MNTSPHNSDSDATTPVLIGEGIAKPAAQASPGATRWLALGAVAGPVLGTLAWIVLGFLRPGYSPISQQISALGIGPNGAFMDAALMLNGLLCIVAVIAIFQALKNELGTAARWTCTALLLLSPFGLLWIGIFTMNTLALHLVGASSRSPRRLSRFQSQDSCYAVSRTGGASVRG